MQRNIADPSGSWANMKGLAYGWLAYADGSYGFSGDDVRQHVLIRILPEKNSGLVIVANYLLPVSCLTHYGNIVLRLLGISGT
jgi:hypothetical protein